MVTSFTVFCCLMVDMVILPVLIGMNVMEHSVGNTSDTMFKGTYADFNGEWYKAVGFQIFLTMIIFSFQPMIDFLVEYVYWKVMRWYNKKYVYKKLNENQTSRSNV